MNQSTVNLTGITWGHTRGYLPLVATAQRYEELNPGVHITWKRLPLEEFSSRSMDKLAHEADMLVISHSLVGHFAERGMAEPLDNWFSQAFLEARAKSSVGRSHESYRYEDSQWALGIDSAAPVAAARMDLLKELKISIPREWDDMIVLAEQGKVATPLAPVDALMHFYMLCETLGERACAGEDAVVSREIGEQALERLRELAVHLDDACFDWTPIRIYEAMTQSDDIAYCPFGFGYSNYAKKRYARRQLKFADLVSLPGHGPLIGPLGGSGICISAESAYKWQAAEYAEFMAVSEIQKGYYIDFGGQPCFRDAWIGDFANAQTDNYFADTLPSLERAFIRPRYDGHMMFQREAGYPIREFLLEGGDAGDVLNRLDGLYARSRD